MAGIEGISRLETLVRPNIERVATLDHIERSCREDGGNTGPYEQN